MKYLVLIGDGMSDYPLRELGGKTPLEAAKTPNLDFLARSGLCGWVNNAPKSLPPASDVCALSILGYDPQKYYTGRGPLEAASLGVKLKKNEIAFRCNLVTVKDGKMKDFTAGHISTAEAAKIMKMLDRKLGSKTIKFIPGLSYRHLLVIRKSKILNPKQIPISNVKTTPPHDITGKPIRKYLPQSDLLLQLMNESEVLLHEMKTKATMIWPWSQGVALRMPSFKKKFGKCGAMITAVHLLKGLAKIVGLTSIDVPGATGYLDTNYIGKAKHALKVLKTHDVVFVHVEAPDEAGHEGDVRKKIKAIEDFDRLVVGTILSKLRTPNSELKILVLPDHPTPIKVMTHTRDAVPFVIWEGGRGQRKAKEGIKGYNEKEIRKAKLRIKQGFTLLERLFYS